jgi:hypothetical protein
MYNSTAKIVNWLLFLPVLIITITAMILLVTAHIHIKISENIKDTKKVRGEWRRVQNGVHHNFTFLTQ